MRSKLILVSLSILSVSFPGSLSQAAEVSCVRSYQASYDDYAKTLKNLQTSEVGSRWAGYILGVTYLGCVAKVRSLAACSLFLGAPTAVAASYHHVTVGEINKLEESHKIYSAYKEAVLKKTDGENMQRIFVATNAKGTQEEFVARELVRAMDSGELCDQSKQAAKSFEEVVKLLEDRKGPLD